MERPREGTRLFRNSLEGELAQALIGVSSTAGFAEALGRFLTAHRVAEEALLAWPESEAFTRAFWLRPAEPTVPWSGPAAAFENGKIPAIRGPRGPEVPFAAERPRRLDLLPREAGGAFLLYRTLAGAGEEVERCGPLLRMAAAFLKQISVLSAGKAQWEKAFDAASEVFLLHGPSGRIFRANMALARLVNLPIRECVGRRCADLLPGLCTPFDTAQRGWSDPASGRHFAVTTQWINLEGEEAALHVLRDITEERKIQALEAEHRQLEFTRNLLQGVAHEIRNPVFAVQTLLQAMALRRIGGDEATPFTEKALSEIRRLDAVVRRFLQLAFLEDGTEAERASLEALSEDAWQEAARALEEEPLPHLALSPQARRTFVRVHRRSFVLALAELFANAAAYSPPGATVHLAAVWEDPRHLRLEIRDLGPGVEETAAARIFEPFFTTRPRKTGLGLTLARAAVEREGGSLTLGVCPPGSPGALFLVRLPVEEVESGEKGP